MEMIEEPLAIARHREQPELHAEDDDQHDPQPEGREAEPGGRQDAEQMVRQAAAPAGREDGERHGQHQRQQDAETQQLDGGHDPLGDHAADRNLVDHRGAEIAAAEIHQEVEVLQDQRLVEPELGADARHRLRRRLAAEQRPDRLPGQRMDQHEGDQADPQQHRQQLQRPIEHEAEAVHGATVKEEGRRRVKATGSQHVPPVVIPAKAPRGLSAAAPQG